MPEPTYYLFSHKQLLCKGDLIQVLSRAHLARSQDSQIQLLALNGHSGQMLEMDLRGSLEEVLERIPAPPALADSEKKNGPGRPKIGVEGKEITLLPRHWEWLASQAGGASVTLRKMVEKAMKENSHADRIRQIQESTYQWMWNLAASEPNYEEASRALFAGDLELFATHIREWPADIAQATLELAHRLKE